MVESLKMKITQLNIYPIKSLRPIALSNATLCAQGLAFDRRYILLKPSANGTYDNMFVGIQTEMALFHCKLLSPTSFQVEYRPAVPSDPPVLPVEILFEPAQSTLEMINVTMHTSSTYPAFRMPDELNTWFSNCFGYKVILAYLGDGLGIGMQDEKAQEWLSVINPALPSQLATVNFSDAAALLVVSEASLEALHARLEGEKAVMEKFRPNIVIDGTTEWDEDFWGEIQLPRAGAKIILTSNCARCMSINVDLDKGSMGEGASGSLLKKMMRDRRIDTGNRWTPIFGRYGFPAIGGEIQVGDEVLIGVRNEQHSVWSMFWTYAFGLYALTDADGIMPRLAALPA